MKKLYILLFYLLLTLNIKPQNFNDTIAYDSMEDYNWLGNWWVGASTTGFFTNTSKSPPTSAVIYGTGNNTYEYDWYSLPNIDTLRADVEHKIQFSVAAQRFTSTGPTSGIDTGDYIDIQVSTDGGNTYNSEVRVTGFNNAYWDFNSKTISKVINGSLDIYTPAGGGDRTLLGDGFSIIELILPLGTTQVAVDIYSRVNRAGEEFWIDDFFLLGSGSGTSLPIDLLSFTAEAHGTSVDINWVVASQINNDYYVIENSLDCYNWKEVDRLDGVGNSNTEMIYIYTDYYAPTGLSYYRLRQVDYDGNSKTFSPKSIFIKDDKTITLKIKPNPAIDYIELEMDYTLDPLINHDVQIFDSDGQRVYKKHFIGEIHDFKINIQKLTPGYYILKTNSDNVKHSGKFIKN